MEFPEMVRLMARAPLSCELLLVTTALPNTEVNVAKRLIPTRAMENRIFIAYCNYPCLKRVADNELCGHTCIAGPDGNFVGGPCKPSEEKLLVRNIRWTKKQYEVLCDTPYLHDRRPDFYRSQGLCQRGKDKKERPPKKRKAAVDGGLAGLVKKRPAAASV